MPIPQISLTNLSYGALVEAEVRPHLKQERQDRRSKTPCMTLAEYDPSLDVKASNSVWYYAFVETSYFALYGRRSLRNGETSSH